MARNPVRSYPQILEVTGDDAEYNSVFDIVKLNDESAEKIRTSGLKLIGCDEDNGLLIGILTAKNFRVHRRTDI